MKQKGKYFSIIYLLSYAAIGVLFPLIAQYLNSIGFSGTEIGIITSSSTAIGIVSNSFWGRIYHERGRKKSLIVLLSIMTALISLFLMGIKQFWVFLVVYVIVFFFENPVYPFLDATVMEVGYSFGKARKWGALGFAAGIGLAGIMADNFGLVTIFPMYCVFFLLTALLLIFYSQSIKGEVFANGNPKKPSKKEKDSYRVLLENKKYVALILSSFFFNGPSLSHNTYFGFLYLGVGGTLAGMGIVLLLMAMSEAPIMAMTDRIARLISTEKALLIAISVSAVRFLWYGFSPPVYLLAGSFFLQGIANGIALVEVVKYIEKLVGTEMLSLALPLFTAISANSGTILSQFLGGVIVGKYGGSGVYIFYGLLNVMAITIYLLAGLHKRV